MEIKPILGVPLPQFIFCLAFTAIFTFIFFFPAIKDFGHVLFGMEDMYGFIWIFWHFEKTVSSGGNPLFADEIFYPYGISLARSTIAPFQSILYLLLPNDWGPFGKITFLQILSFVLGGIFSFSLAYKFTKSGFSSLIGSIVFNFSQFHFEKALHHLNYNMAFAFLPLFFLFYLNSLEQPKNTRRHLMLSLSLLLIGLNEITVAVMAGFIVFIDIMLRYAKYCDVKLITPKNLIISTATMMISLVLFESAVSLTLPLVVSYVIIPGLFLFICLFVILGKKKLVLAEKQSAYFKTVLISALPMAALLIFLFLQPSYDFKPESLVVDIIVFFVSLEKLMMPSTLTFIPLRPIELGAEVYLGLFTIFLFLFSLFLGNASEEERHIRTMLFFSFVFSFPIMIIGNYPVFFSLIPETLFPLLPVLRVPARFIMFVLLFLSIIIALFIKRMAEGKQFSKLAKAGCLLILVLVMAERWPNLERFRFDASTPEFYVKLAKQQAEKPILLYPNMGYANLLSEIYYQTIHGKKLSYGWVSRFPNRSDPVFFLYSIENQMFLYKENDTKPDKVIEVAKMYNYSYITVQKQGYSYKSLDPHYQPYPEQQLEPITDSLTKELGAPVYEDSKIVVYAVNK